MSKNLPVPYEGHTRFIPLPWYRRISSPSKEAWALLLFVAVGVLWPPYLGQTTSSIRMEELSTGEGHTTLLGADGETHYVSADYAYKVEWLRSEIKHLWPGNDFVSEQLYLLGPKIIMKCIEDKHNNPGEKFAQILYESSKNNKKGKRVWSGLTEKWSNFGGVKAKKGEKASEPVTTHEYYFNKKTGKKEKVWIKAKFRAADNKWLGINDYFDLLNRPRYARAKKLRGYGYFYMLGRCGYYTTDKDTYSDTGITFMKRHKLNKLNDLFDSIPTCKPSSTGGTPCGE